MERTDDTRAATETQPGPNRAAAEGLAMRLWGEIESPGSGLLMWSSHIEEALDAAVQAERSRWLSRIEGLRSKARERVS